MLAYGAGFCFSVIGGVRTRYAVVHGLCDVQPTAPPQFFCWHASRGRGFSTRCHPLTHPLPSLMYTLCRKERGLLDPAKRDPNERYCSLGDKLTEMGRCGQKTGAWAPLRGSSDMG